MEYFTCYLIRGAWVCARVMHFLTRAGFRVSCQVFLTGCGVRPPGISDDSEAGTPRLARIFEDCGRSLFSERYGFSIPDKHLYSVTGQTPRSRQTFLLQARLEYDHRRTARISDDCEAATPRSARIFDDCGVVLFPERYGFSMPDKHFCYEL